MQKNLASNYLPPERGIDVQTQTSKSTQMVLVGVGQASDSENSDSGNNTTGDLNQSGQQDDHELEERRHLTS